MATYAFSDLHGYLNIYHQIKKYVKPEDKLFCLGDCGDRGPDPWDTIKAVLTDPQITYLKGNHEDMLVKATREVMDGSYGCETQRLLAMNGGTETLEELLGEESPERWMKELSQLPTIIKLENKKGQKIALSHAGYSAWKDDDEVIPPNKDLIWERLHHFDSAKLLSDIIIVHGHTSIKHIAMDLGILAPYGALEYADGKKYCIDAGTHRSHRSILFDLDTFESKVFRVKD